LLSGYTQRISRSPPKAAAATMPVPRRRFLLVSNPIAGRLGRRLLEPVIGHLKQAGATVARAPAGGIEVARRAIAEAAAANDVDAVLVAGGDGTFRMAATVLLGKPLAIGLLPLGTGNVLAHELELPRDPRQLAQIFLRAPTIPLAAALANGAPFFLMAGAGFDGAVIARLNHTWKHRIGKLAYVTPALRALAAPLPELDVTIDGTRHAATWAITANACHYGGKFVLVPYTNALDAGLHTVLFQARDRLMLTRQLLALARGQLLPRADVAMLPCQSVRMHSYAPVPVQIDGDEAGTTPLDIERSRQAVQVIVPVPVARQAQGSRA
jgi:diacylglycerol kinase (ATP)